ncbi:MAG: endonuclease/exonuclease/phosphatase family protein [bacterium]
MSLSFVQLNIESDKHLSEVKRIFQAQPDVVHLQEVFRADAEELASQYGYYCHYAPHVIFEDASAKFNPRGEWGVAILTKAKQSNCQTEYYRYQGTPVKAQLDAQDHPRAIISCDIEVEEQVYTFATLHFTWAMPVDADRLQKEDLERLLSILKKYSSLVLSGDFNAPRGSLVQTELASRYQYHIPRIINTTIDNSLHRAAPLFLVVDHLFATPDYKITNVRVESGYSDHCAIFASITKVTT